jgi:predicted secreted protein
MSVTSAIVLLAVIWFMVFFVVLPLRNTTQADAGEVVPGTPASAPANAVVKQKAKITSIWAFGIWIIVTGTILSGVITVRDFDWFDRMSTPILTN